MGSIPEHQELPPEAALSVAGDLLSEIAAGDGRDVHEAMGAIARLTASRLGLSLTRGTRSPERLRGIARVLRRAVQTDPQRRYPTAAAMRTALARAAAAGFGEDWRDAAREQLAALPAPRAAVTVRTQRRPSRRGFAERLIIAMAMVILPVTIGLTVGATIAQLQGARRVSAAVLRVQPPLAVRVQPPAGSCNTTFDVQVDGQVSGHGSLVYRWERSDGARSPDTTLSVALGDTAFRVHEEWTVPLQTRSPALTFRLLSPAPMAVTQTLEEHCP